MGVNKVVYNNQTLVDLTADSVTGDVLLEGYTAHNASGDLITGTLPLSGLNYIINLESGTADRTQAEINNAYAEGRLLIVKQDGKNYFLQCYDLESGYCFLNRSKQINSVQIVNEYIYYYGGKWSTEVVETTEEDINNIIAGTYVEED